MITQIKLGVIKHLGKEEQRNPNKETAGVFKNSKNRAENSNRDGWHERGNQEGDPPRGPPNRTVQAHHLHSILRSAFFICHQRRNRVRYDGKKAQKKLC